MNNKGIEFKPVKCKKISFLNEAQAIFYIDKLRNTSTRTKVPTRAYLCQDCLNWHLTSKGAYADENPLIENLREKCKNLEAEIKLKDAEIKKLVKALKKNYAITNILKKEKKNLLKQSKHQ